MAGADLMGARRLLGVLAALALFAATCGSGGGEQTSSDAEQTNSDVRQSGDFAEDGGPETRRASDSAEPDSPGGEAAGPHVEQAGDNVQDAGERAGPGGADAAPAGEDAEVTGLGAEQGSAGAERADPDIGLAGVYVPLNRGFASLSAGARCGFRGDGTRQCWWGAASIGAPGGDFVAIDGNRLGGMCGIRPDGTLECWGGHSDDIAGPPEDRYPDFEQFPFSGERFTALSGGTYACAIGADRSVACTNYGYPIGWNPYIADAHVPDGEFESVSAGHPHMCGVRMGGELTCWRSSWEEPSAVLSPPGGRFESVAVGRHHACAVRSGGEVACWGDEERADEYGQFSLPAGSFQSVAVARWFSCGLRDDGEVTCWGRSRAPTGWNADGGPWPQGPFVALDVDDESVQICVLRPSGVIVCWNDGSGTHEPPDGSFVALDAGPTATCGLRPGGEVACWGHDRGREHHGDLYPLDWDVPAGPFTAVSVGDGYACALRPGGEVACWGRGTRRPAGGAGVARTAEERDNRARLEPPPGPFTAISAFDEFTCALRTDSTIACWGMHDTDFDVELAEPPAGPFTSVRAGHHRACGLRPDGEAICWSTDDGQQTPIGDGAFAALPDGKDTPCALRHSGQLACSGHHSDLATNAPGTPLRSVATMGHRACGLDPSRGIACWLTGIRQLPTPPGPFIAVTVGGRHSCGLRPDGTAECWTPHWPPSADPAPAAS